MILYLQMFLCWQVKVSFRCSTSATSANTAIKSIEFSKRGRYVSVVDYNNTDLYPLEQGCQYYGPWAKSGLPSCYYWPA